MRVIIKNKRDIGSGWRGREGKIVATVKNTVISGHKRCIRTEYIVQFTKPAEWSYFYRRDLMEVADGHRSIRYRQ